MTVTAATEPDEAVDGRRLGASPPGQPGWAASSWETSSRHTANWLIAHRFELEQGEARWLARLADFDEEGGWAAEGHISCANWLLCHTQMSRSTAFEKLQVARALRRRPLVADAFNAGHISYSVVRILSRLTGVSPEVDAALIRLARIRTVTELEQAARAYRLHPDEDNPPPEPKVQPSIAVTRVDDRHRKIEATLTDLEAEEFLGTIRLFMPEHATQSAAADQEAAPAGQPAATDPDGAPDLDAAPAAGSSGADGQAAPAAAQSAAADSPVAHDRRRQSRRDYRRRQVDGLLAMLRAAAARPDDPAAVGADRHLVHIVVDHGIATLADGSPLPPDQAAQALCDASIVTHHYQDGEPLSLGRKTRIWTTAQRRAALVRDGGHCRFPGCRRRMADLHHHRPWQRGGPTDLANGYTLCRRHHTLLHQRGFFATGAPNDTLTFHAPDGQPIGATAPVIRGVPGSPPAGPARDRPAVP